MGLYFDDDEVKEKLSVARGLLRPGQEDSNLEAIRLYAEMMDAGVSRAAVELADFFLLISDLSADGHSKKPLLGKARYAVCRGLDIENDPDTGSRKTLFAIMAYMNQLELSWKKNPDTTMKVACMLYNYLQDCESGECEELDPSLKLLMCHYIALALNEYDRIDYNEETDYADEIDEMLICFCSQAGDGDQQAKNILAGMYLWGGRHNNEAIKNTDKAIEIMQKLKNANAFFALGGIYGDDDYGKKNIDKAVSYYAQAGDYGHENGYLCAGLLLHNENRIGEAEEYFQKGAKAGNEECIKNFRLWIKYINP